MLALIQEARDKPDRKTAAWVKRMLAQAAKYQHDLNAMPGLPSHVIDAMQTALSGLQHAAQLVASRDRDMRDIIEEIKLLNEAKTMGLVPSYGRDYKSKRAIEADLNADKDFNVSDISSPWDGRPVNKSQLVADGYTQVKVRYAKMRKVAMIKLKK